MIEKATPIWTETNITNQYIDAFCEFYIDEIPEKAELEIFAPSGYAVFINSGMAGTSRYRTFPDKAAYCTHDIIKLLKKGKNTLNITAYNQGLDTSCDCVRQGALLYAIKAGDKEIYSDKNTYVRENPYYKNGAVEVVSNQLGYTFHYDASAQEGEWEKAKTVRDFSAELIKCPVENLLLMPLEEGKLKTQGHLIRNTEGSPAGMMQRDFMSHKKAEEIFDGNTVKQNEGGVYFIKELEHETAGFIYMEIDAPEGTVIDIGYGEHLDDMRVRTRIGTRHFAARYISGGKDKFTSYFLRVAAKYLEVHITNMTGDIKINKLGIIPTEYPLRRIAKFNSGDFLFDRIYDVALRTMKLCMHEHYEDCPWREQALYAFDSYVQMLCGYYAFGEYKFAKASLWLLASGILENGYLPITAPSNVKHTITCFSLSWIMSLEKYVLYSGDIKFGIEMLDTAKRILDAYKIKDGLLRLETDRFYWHFYEWTDGLDGTTFKDSDLDAPSNLMYIIACDCYDSICRMTGTEAKVTRKEEMKKAFVKTFYNEEKHLFRTRLEDEKYHEFTQSLALLAGFGDEELTDKLADSNNDMVKVSLSTSLFKYTALLESGDKYADIVLHEISRIWGDMIASGADTLWETQTGADDFDYAGSLCHAWSAVPVYLWFRYYIGYRPTKPGFEEYEIKPIKNSILKNIKGDLLKPGN